MYKNKLYVQSRGWGGSSPAHIYDTPWYDVRNERKLDEKTLVSYQLKVNSNVKT